MRTSLLAACLATAVSAFDTCSYLVSDPLLSNLLHARNACSSFQQSTTSLCPTTTTTTLTLTYRTNAPVKSVPVTVTITSRISTTTTTTIQGLNTLSRTLTAIPSGPIDGSQDINKRAADAILCPRLVGPDVPGTFAFFCQAPAFASACNRIGITATIQKQQSTATVTRTSASTLVLSQTTFVVTSTTLKQTAVVTKTTTVPHLETQAPPVPYFYLSANGLHFWTGGDQPGDALSLVTFAANLFSIGSQQDLEDFGRQQIYVNGGTDNRLRVGPIGNRDPRCLRCEFSQATSGNLTCVSGPPGNVTTKFQLCNNDNAIYHAAGLQAGCQAVRVYNGDPYGTG